MSRTYNTLRIEKGYCVMGIYSVLFAWGGPHKHGTHLYMKGMLVRYIQWSQILAIQNSNHTQEYKYLSGKPFFFEGKIHGTNSE